MATKAKRGAAQELLLRRKARESLLAYMKFMYDSGHPDFAHAHELAPHQLLLIEELQHLADGSGTKLAVSMPPGSAKSQIASVAFPTWMLARNPALQIIAIAATETLSEQFSRRRRNAMVTPEWEMLAKTQLAPDQRSLTSQATLQHGQIRSGGMGSSIVGTRADLTLVDDPVASIEEAFSTQRLDQQQRWFDAELRSRLKPGGSEAIVMTRWSPFDLVGVAEERHEGMKEIWRFVRLPMEADESADPLGREIGALLWPDHYTDQQITEAKQNPLLWNGLYQQRPVVNTGEWASMENVHVIDREPEGHFACVLSIDLALTISAKADYTVIMAALIDADKNIFITDMYRRQATTNLTAAATADMARSHEPGMILIDLDNASRVWAVHAQEIAKKTQTPLPIRPLRHKNRDKQTRAAALRSHIAEGRLYLVRAPWNAVVLQELSRFPMGRHDDCVDTLANISREIHTIAPRQKEDTKRTEIKTSIIALPIASNDERLPLPAREVTQPEDEFAFIGDAWGEKRFEFEKSRIGGE